MDPSALKNVLLTGLLYLHIVTGAVALASGGIALAAAKGERLHKRAGFVFFLSMLAVALSAFLIAVFKQIHFLLAIAVFSFYMNFTGYRSATNPSGKFTWYDGAVQAFAFVNAAVMLLSLQPLLVFFSFILLFLIINHVRGLRATTKNASERSHWRVIQHLTHMTGTYIATVTAFLVVNINFVKPGWLLWLLPTFAGVPFILYYTRSERQKMKKR